VSDFTAGVSVLNSQQCQNALAGWQEGHLACKGSVGTGERIIKKQVANPTSTGQGSALADKPARHAASPWTCCKQIRWTVTVINLSPNEADNVSRWKSPSQLSETAHAINLPHLHFMSPLEWPVWVLLKLECDLTFSHFKRTLTCDRYTDRWTDKHTATANTHTS